MKKKRHFNRREYKKAFEIACSLMNGDIWYGVDKDTIYIETMNKQGTFSCLDYERYILSNLSFFTDSKHYTDKEVKDG